jgi:hypothetical protein
LLDSLKIYQEAQLIVLLGLDSLRNMSWSSFTATPIPISAILAADWQALANEVDEGTNLLLGPYYQTVSQSEISIEVLLSIN